MPRAFTNQRAVGANADERIRVRIARPTPASTACSRPIKQLVFKFNQYCHTFSPKITVVARNLRLHAADKSVQQQPSHARD